MLLNVDKSESISITCNHFESEEKFAVLEQILEETIKILGDNGFSYRHSVCFPNPLQISEVISGQSIINETTEDCYSLIKVENS